MISTLKCFSFLKTRQICVKYHYMFYFDYYKPSSVLLPQDILSLAEARLSHTSSAAVCRKLSSIGRRVLSIESVSTFQGHFVISIYKCQCLVSAVITPGTNCSLCISTDGQEGSWEARWQHPKPRCLLKRLSSDDNTKDLCVDSSVKANGLSRQQVCDRLQLQMFF